MTITPLGKIAPAAAGTPKPISVAAPSLAGRAHRIFFAQLPGQTGAVYIGRLGMVKGTLAGVIRVFAIPTATGLLDHFAITCESGEQIEPSEYCVDADVNNEGALVSIWQ
jgi:hypothetical protein